MDRTGTAKALSRQGFPLTVLSGARPRRAGINGSTRRQNASVTSHDVAPIPLTPGKNESRIIG